MDMYRGHALEGASGVELTIALYDGIIRFMHNAIEAVERKDVEAASCCSEAGDGHRGSPAGDVG